MNEHIPFAYLNGDALLASMLADDTCSVTEDKNCNHTVKAAGVTAKIEPFWHEDVGITGWYLTVRVGGKRKSATYPIHDEGLVDRAMDISKVQERDSDVTVMQQAMAKLFHK